MTGGFASAYQHRPVRKKKARTLSKNELIEPKPGTLNQGARDVQDARQLSPQRLNSSVSPFRRGFQRLTNELPRNFPPLFGHTPVVFHFARFHQKPPKTRTAPTHARQSACKRPQKLFSPIVTFKSTRRRPNHQPKQSVRTCPQMHRPVRAPNGAPGCSHWWSKAPRSKPSATSGQHQRKIPAPAGAEESCECAPNTTQNAKRPNTCPPRELQSPETE